MRNFLFISFVCMFVCMLFFSVYAIEPTVTIKSYAEMTALTDSTTVVNIVSGTGIDGQFYWDSSSVETTNNGTIFQRDGGGNGRWKRVISGEIRAGWFGVVGDGITDDTAALQAAIDATNNGQKLTITHGTFVISSPLVLRLKLGIKISGERGFAYGSSGTIIYWNGSSGQPMLLADFLKFFTIESICFKSNNNTAKAAILFTKDQYCSNGEGVISDCLFIGCDTGVMIGDYNYNNDNNTSELKFYNCYFQCRVGVYIAGCPNGGQQVNNHFYSCDFAGVEQGIHFAGGHANFINCTWNGAYSSVDYTAIYIEGDKSMSQPIWISGGYAEQINRFIESEYTTTVTQFYRSASIIVTGGYYHCNRVISKSPFFITTCKALKITLESVTVLGDIDYRPPVDSAFAGYSSSAPNASQLVLLGQNSLQNIAVNRGGNVNSHDQNYESTVPSGCMYPNTGTYELVLTQGSKNYKRHRVILASGNNGSYFLDKITGGHIGDIVEFEAQYSFRSFTMRNNNAGGNIRLAGGTSTIFLLNGVSKITLMKNSSGNWCEISRDQP